MRFFAFAVRCLLTLFLLIFVNKRMVPRGWLSTTMPGVNAREAGAENVLPLQSMPRPFQSVFIFGMKLGKKSRQVYIRRQLQLFPDTSKPFRQHTIKDKGIVYAVDYDMVRNGVAYFDKDTADYRVDGQRGAGNRGRIYRNDCYDWCNFFC